MTTHVATLCASLTTEHGQTLIPLRVCAGDTVEAARGLAEGVLREVAGVLSVAMQCQLVGPTPDGEGMGALMPAKSLLAMLGVKSVQLAIVSSEAQTSNLIVARGGMV